MHIYLTSLFYLRADWCDDTNPQLRWALEFAMGCKFSLCSIVHFNVLYHGSHRYQPHGFFLGLLSQQQSRC